MNDMPNNSIKLGDTNVTFNAPCTGMMQKSHPKSHFTNFQDKSPLSNLVFSDFPRITTDRKDKIVILQIMCYNDNWFLVEYVYEKDINSLE